MSGDDQKSHFHFFHFYFPLTFSTFTITFWFVKVLPALFIILGPEKSSHPPQCPRCHSFANWWRQELALFTFSFLISFFIFFLWSLSFYYSNYFSWICIPASMSPFIWQSRLVMKISCKFHFHLFTVLLSLFCSNFSTWNCISGVISMDDKKMHVFTFTFNFTTLLLAAFKVCCG